MNKKKYILFFIFIYFLFSLHVSAIVIGKKCSYTNPGDRIVNKLELNFKNAGNSDAILFYTPSWAQVQEEMSISIENFDEAVRNQQATGSCPAYVLMIDGNWLEGDKRSYYAVFDNEEYEEIVDDHAGWGRKVTTLYYYSQAEIDDGADPNGNPARVYSKIYYPLLSGEFGDLKFTVTYDEVNAQFKSEVLSFSDNSEKILRVYDGDLNSYQQNILEPIRTSNSFPTDFWCGTIRAYLTLAPGARLLTGSDVKDGDIVCATDKNLFVDSASTLVHFQEVDHGFSNKKFEIDSGGNVATEVEDLGYKISDIALGNVCKRKGLKVPLKYIGWILSAIKLIIPFIIIILGVMDFLKAIASQKPEELSKAIRTLMIRILSGVVIFLVPMMINFLFTLVDEWSDYSTAYSECTKCLADPKNCNVSER